MQSGGADTHELAIQAGKQADAAGRLADQAKAQSEKMAESISQLAAEVSATNNLATESKRSADLAEKGLSATQEADRNRERAWIGLTDFTIVEFDKSESFKFSVRFSNTGETPALMVSDTSAYKFADPGTLGPEKDWITSVDNETEPLPALAPHGTVKLNFGVPIEGRYDDLIAGKQWLYLWGEVNYKDRSGLISGLTK
jgi:hypothetical protein